MHGFNLGAVAGFMQRQGHLAMQLLIALNVQTLDVVSGCLG